MLTHPLLTPMCDWSRRVRLHVASKLDILKVKGYEAEAAGAGVAKRKPRCEKVDMWPAEAGEQPPRVLLPAPNWNVSPFRTTSTSTTLLTFSSSTWWPRRRTSWEAWSPTPCPRSWTRTAGWAAPAASSSARTKSTNGGGGGWERRVQAAPSLPLQLAFWDQSSGEDQTLQKTNKKPCVRRMAPPLPDQTGTQRPWKFENGAFLHVQRPDHSTWLILCITHVWIWLPALFSTVKHTG